MPDERSTKIREAIAQKDIWKLRDIRSDLIMEVAGLRKKVDDFLSDAHWLDIKIPENRKKRDELINEAHIAKSEWTKKNRELDDLSHHIERMNNLVGVR